MTDYNVIVKGQQVLLPIDSGLLKELITLAIYAKKQLKINDSDWNHSPELYEEMFKNHKKVMEQAIHLPQGNHVVQI
jgi:hypothetical protein